MCSWPIRTPKLKLLQILEKRVGADQLTDWSWIRTPDSKFTKGHTAVLPGNAAVLWLSSDRLGADEIATISHEAFHASMAC